MLVGEFDDQVVGDRSQVGSVRETEGPFGGGGARGAGGQRTQLGSSWFR